MDVVIQCDSLYETSHCSSHCTCEMPQTRLQHSDQIWSLSLGHHQSRQYSLAPTSKQNADPMQVHIGTYHVFYISTYLYTVRGKILEGLKHWRMANQNQLANKKLANGLTWFQCKGVTEIIGEKN